MGKVETWLCILGALLLVIGSVWYASITWAHPEKTTRLLWLEHGKELLPAFATSTVGFLIVSSLQMKKLA